MSDVVIRVENLSKHYRLGTIGGATLREDLQRWWAKARGRPDPLLKIGTEDHGNREGGEIWALRDVSFEVRQGEVLGIIGRNGAGKSTLLKILSRTTAPTSGRALVRGRIGSLLEVGTGFHPELTGRENIYLNGAILGMKKSEIDRKLDEIIEFSGVEQFIDTPVKRYSSGMYVRLAFAVAAHLEPEVLIVDEVLAVGDAAFQKKCIGKMEHVAQGGKTVMFVSHNMGVIASLCRSAVVLRGGQLAFQGSVSEAISTYLASDERGAPGDSGDLAIHRNRIAGVNSYLRRVQVQDAHGRLTGSVFQSDNVVLVISYEASRLNEELTGCGFNIRSALGIRVAGFNTYMVFKPPHKLPQSGSIRFEMCGVTLTPGTYFVTPSLASHQGTMVDQVEDAVSFTVQSRDIYGTGYLLTPEDGVSALRCRVEVNDCHLGASHVSAI